MLLLGIMAIGASIFIMGYWAGQASRSPGGKAAQVAPPKPASAPPAPKPQPAESAPSTGDPVGKVIAAAENANGLEIEPIEDDPAAPKTATTVVFPDSLTAKEVKEDFKPEPKADLAPKAIETKPETKPEVKEEAPANPWAMKKEEPKPEAKPEPKAVPTGGSSAYVIQVASSQDLAQAQKKVDELLGMGFADAEVQSAEIPGKGLWHRAIIGGYATRDAAQKDVAKVAAKCKCKPMARAR